MDVSAEFITNESTGFFSKMVVDYINESPNLKPFYQHSVSIEGVKLAIKKRQTFETDRALLVKIFTEQYQQVQLSQKQKTYLNLLGENNTFTICTAHQPNIFTGYLYFVYKILHAVKLAEELKIKLPQYNFVPVYYMGSEDADLDELGHIFIKGEKFQWQTTQTGAVGRMKVDKALLQLLALISGQLAVYPYGKEIIELVKEAYQINTTIEQATFKLVNSLFAGYGLLTLLPDSDAVKRAFIPVIKKELIEGFSHKAVIETVAIFPTDYKVQASGRPINLFYLLDDKRVRIEKNGNDFVIPELNLKFTPEEILQHLEIYPQRFSPNVILRPVLQETILPDIAFIGGGGEIAYWLELKKVFDTVAVPYPILVVRNSFVFVSKELQLMVKKLQLKNIDLFKPTLQIINELVKSESSLQLQLDEEKKQLIQLYQSIKVIAGKIDETLKPHTEALQTKAIKKIESLQKKMLSAEKKKFEYQQRQVEKLKMQLFFNNNLQERSSNILPFYANWGKDFIEAVYLNSKGLSQEFGIILE